MKSVVYSAPAKIIISGEHAVVYGKPALVSALNLRLTFNIWEAKKQNSDTYISYIRQLIRKYLKEKEYGLQDKIFDYSVDSDIPIGKGLGSSAALSVAAIAALLDFYTGKTFDKEIVNNLAYIAEKRFHTKPSGTDNTASVFGGLIYYRKEFEFLKNISALNFKIPKNISDKLYFIDSGKPYETTAKMVQKVGTQYNAYPEKTEGILNTIEKITKRIVVSIIKEDVNFFAENIEKNQKMLEKLDVVSEKTRTLLHTLRNFGVGKITGAGGKTMGSGYILFFAENSEKLEIYLRNNNKSYFKYEQNIDGVKKLS